MCRTVPIHHHLTISSSCSGLRCWLRRWSVNSSRLKIGGSLLQIALEDVVGNLNAQWHSSQWEQLARSISARAHRLVLNVVRWLVRHCSVRLNRHRGNDIGRRESVEPPMYPEIDTADGVVEHGIPQAREPLGDVSPHHTQLILERLRWIVGLTQVATQTIQFIRRRGEADVVCRIIRERQLVAFLVVETHRLEKGSPKGSMSRRVRWERRLYGNIVRVRLRSPLGQPKWISLWVSNILANPSEWPPELKSIFCEPGKDTGFTLSDIGKSEQPSEVGVVCFVGYVGSWLFVDSNPPQELVIVPWWCSDQICPVISPEETGDRLVRSPPRRVERLAPP